MRAASRPVRSLCSRNATRKSQSHCHIKGGVRSTRARWDRSRPLAKEKTMSSEPYWNFQIDQTRLSHSLRQEKVERTSFRKPPLSTQHLAPRTGARQ
jgi:hypothetical protein